MMYLLLMIIGFVVGFAAFPLLVLALRNVLPPTLFTPDDW